MEENKPKEIGKNSSNFTSRDKKVLAFAIIIFIVQYIFLQAPSNATIGYHIGSIVLPIISYSFIIYIISVFIATVAHKFNRIINKLTLFAWLWLAAASLDLVVGLYKLYLYYRIISILGV